MRISTVTMFQQSLTSMNRQQSEFLKVGQQIASGRRVVTPADDPQASSRAVRVSQSQAVTQQNTDSRVSARNTLAQSESVLNSATDVVIRAKTLLVQAASDTLSDSDRKAVASELRGLHETLLGQANATDGNGTYLFAGYQDEGPPFIRASSDAGMVGVEYRGDDQVREQRVDASRIMPVTDNGKMLFQSVASGSTYVARAEKTAPNPSDIDLGTQVGYVRNEGSVTFSGPTRVDASHANFGDDFRVEFNRSRVDASALLNDGVVDVSQGELTGFTPSVLTDSSDIVNALEATSEIVSVVDQSAANDGSELVVTFAEGVADDFDFTLESATNNHTAAFTNAIQVSAVKVQEVDASSLLRDGNVSLSAGALTGFTSAAFNESGELIEALEATDEIVRVVDKSPDKGGSELVVTFAEGLSNDFSFTLESADNGYTASFSNDDTELLGPQDYESGETLTFGGVSIAVEGEPAVGDQIQVRPADDALANQDLFKTLKDAIDVLEIDQAGLESNHAHVHNTIDTMMRELDNGLDNILTRRASVGARLNELDVVDTASSTRALNFDRTMSELVDLDYGEAVTEYSLRQVGLQAAQRAFVDIQGMSLFDFMR
ncbi:flagellar hook-associated protein 3 [Halochromatium glycolicum]|uniref:Flagellar hook-associated protein 3 n=2 Tax=Halochromatium glycolicum TaxID=85075 RepID=A0AAJ0U1W1_9GAMM|nr:flagellar hook-associated protein 3 [Halochromatium glycolicum]